MHNLFLLSGIQNLGHAKFYVAMSCSTIQTDTSLNVPIYLDFRISSKSPRFKTFWLLWYSTSDWNFIYYIFDWIYIGTIRHSSLLNLWDVFTPLGRLTIPILCHTELYCFPYKILNIVFLDDIFYAFKSWLFPCFSISIKYYNGSTAPSICPPPLTTLGTSAKMLETFFAAFPALSIWPFSKFLNRDHDFFTSSRNVSQNAWNIFFCVSFSTASFHDVLLGISCCILANLYEDFYTKIVV